MVHIEHTRCTCDHCDQLRQGIIITSIVGDEISSIQLCSDCSIHFGTEMRKAK